VFSGEISARINTTRPVAARLKYQGIRAPGFAQRRPTSIPSREIVPTSPANFPMRVLFPGRHPANFQFSRSLAKIAGCTASAHRCSIYDSKPAGAKLNAMLSMGLSQPWPNALAALTGQNQMDATAILDYFAPLKKWRNEQNKGKTVGW